MPKMRARISHVGDCPAWTAVETRPHESSRRPRAILAPMQPADPLCAELEATWHREIPLAAAIGIEIATSTDDELTVHAPMAANVNVHGTAFAGSLFSVAVLAGWGAVWLALRRAGLKGRIVVIDSAIRYRKAVTGDILCRGRTEPVALAAALEALRTSGRATLTVACAIDCRGMRAVDFTGDYAIRVRAG